MFKNVQFKKLWTPSAVAACPFLWMSDPRREMEPSPGISHTGSADDHLHGRQSFYIHHIDARCRGNHSIVAACAVEYNLSVGCRDKHAQALGPAHDDVSVAHRHSRTSMEGADAAVGIYKTRDI